MNISYEQFLDFLKENRIELRWGKIYSRWRGGGMSGGSASPGEPEPDFDSLDIILKAFWPNISYFEFKELKSKLFEYDEEGEHDYYETYRYTLYKEILALKLYNYLSEKIK
jgi:hypothetical protein